MKSTKVFFVAIGLCLVPVVSNAQETCSDEQRSALETCISDCQTTCAASYPTCQKTPISLDDLRNAIAEQCNCDTARNYGKYRSCVAHLINALKKFSLVDDASKAAIDADNAACRDAINGRKGNKGKKNKE